MADPKVIAQPGRNRSATPIGTMVDLQHLSSVPLRARPTSLEANYRKSAILSACLMTRSTWCSAPTGGLPDSLRLPSPHA
jgi:hypothetical protein